MNAKSRKDGQTMLRITQVRSRIGNQARVVRVLTDGLNLGRIGSAVELPDNPYTRGMVAKVAHIVKVEEIASSPAKGSRRRSTPRAKDEAETVSEETKNEE